MTVTLITGAASGIGRATAERLAERGDDLICIDSDPAVASVVPTTPSRLALVVDVTDERAVKEAVAEGSRVLGPIDNAVTCAGITRHQSLFELDLEVFRRVYEVNVMGSLITARTVASSMIEYERSGSIVLVGSINSVVAPTPLTAYASSKGAVLMLGRSLAVELADHGIRVNVVGPGPTNTPLISAMRSDTTASGRWESRIPLRRFAEPGEIASVIEFLTSTASSYVTGAFVPVDGGLLSA